MYQPKLVTWEKYALVTGNLIPKTTKRFLQFLFVWSFLGGILPLHLAAQTTHEIDFKEIQHSVTVAGGTLDADEVGTVTLSLGTVADPVEGAGSLRLDVVLSAYAVLPSALSVDVSGSWMLGDCAVSQDLVVEDSLRTLHLYLNRDAGFQSGNGFVVSFPIVCNANDVPANSLVVSDGGIVIVENVDMRMAQFPLVLDERAYLGSRVCFPNPSRGQLHVPITEAGPANLRLIGLDGSIHLRELASCNGISVVDIASLPRGMYLLEVVQAGRLVVRERIMRE